MGNSNKKNNKYDEIREKLNKKLDDSNIEKDKLEKKKFQKDIQKLEEERKDKIKYELNIYFYSNYDIDKDLIDYISNYNNNIFNWKIKIVEGGFSQLNSDKLIKNFKEDFEKKQFKNILIIPIKSILNFKKDIEKEENNIFVHFNKNLICEQQTFFLFIDYDQSDFIKTQKNEVTIQEFMKLKRLESDFEISICMKIKKEESEQIEIFKEFVRKKKGT